MNKRDVTFLIALVLVLFIVLLIINYQSNIVGRKPSLEDKTTKEPILTQELSDELKTIQLEIKKQGADWEADENPIFLLSDEEKMNLVGEKFSPPDVPDKQIVEPLMTQNLPETFDWRDQHGEDYLSSVKHQGQCGSCWAFATTGALEGVAEAYYNDPNLELDLSEQDLISCFNRIGCSGGMDPSTDYLLFNYLINEKISDEDSFTYTACDGVCGGYCNNYPDCVPCENKNSGWLESAWGINSWEEIPLDTDYIKYAVATKGPLITIMKVYQDFYAYTGGIYENISTFYRGVHRVIIVGYGVEDGNEYWIIKNSWGSGWGENGYFRIKVGASFIDSWAVYAVNQPVSPAPLETNCDDNDNDGYCNWGLGEKPTTGCPGTCAGNPIEDCNDDPISGGNLFENCGTLNFEFGSLSVVTSVSGAKVFVKDVDTGDYIFRGTTPIEFQLDPGLREIKITKKDYTDYIETDILIEQGETTYLNPTLYLTTRFSYPRDIDFVKLNDIIEIKGTAPGPDFQNFIIEWGLSENPIEWFTTGIDLVNNGNNEIIDDVLATWDTSFMQMEEVYSLKLTVDTLYGQKEAFSRGIKPDPYLKKNWPQKINSWIGHSNVVTGDVDNDGDEEILFSDIDWNVHMYHHDGTIFSGWPIHLNLMPCPTYYNCEVSAPTLVDIDDDEDLEIFFYIANNQFLGTQVYAFHHDGSNVNGWPKQVIGSRGVIANSLLVEDLNNDGDYEIIVPVIKGNLTIFSESGNLLLHLDPMGDVGSGAAVGNLDSDSNLEIVFSTYESGVARRLYAINLGGTNVSGWPETYVSSSGNTNTAYDDLLPVIGDIDNDGSDEVVLSYPGKTFAFNKDSSDQEGAWPQTHSRYDAYGVATLADIDNDNDLEIIHGGYRYGKIYAFEDDGSEVIGEWPLAPLYGTSVSSAPTVGDLDNDGTKEITLSTYAAYTWEEPHWYILNSDGTSYTFWPKQINSIYSGQDGYFFKHTISPVITDLENNGIMDLIMISTDGYIYIWEFYEICEDETFHGQCSDFTVGSYCDNGFLIPDCRGPDNLINTGDDCCGFNSCCKDNGICGSCGSSSPLILKRVIPETMRASPIGIEQPEAPMEKEELLDELNQTVEEIIIKESKNLTQKRVIASPMSREENILKQIISWLSSFFN